MRLGLSREMYFTVVNSVKLEVQQNMRLEGDGGIAHNLGAWDSKNTLS